MLRPAKLSAALCREIKMRFKIFTSVHDLRGNGAIGRCQGYHDHALTCATACTEAGMRTHARFALFRQGTKKKNHKLPESIKETWFPFLEWIHLLSKWNRNGLDTGSRYLIEEELYHNIHWVTAGEPTSVGPRSPQRSGKNLRCSWSQNQDLG